MTALFLVACVVPPTDVVEVQLPPSGCSAIMYVAAPVPTCSVREEVSVTARDGRSRLRCSAEEWVSGRAWMVILEDFDREATGEVLTCVTPTCGSLRLRVVPGIANDRVGGYPQPDCPPWSGAPGLQFLTTRP